MCGRRGFEVWCINLSPAASFLLLSSRAIAAKLSRAGNPTANASFASSSAVGYGYYDYGYYYDPGYGYYDYGYYGY